MDYEQDQEKALRQVKAFATKSDHFGIPSDIFYAIIGFSILAGSALRSPLMIIVFLLFFGVPAYNIHKEDPHALKVWIKAVKRWNSYWCAGKSRSRKYVVLEKEEL